MKAGKFGQFIVVLILLVSVSSVASFDCRTQQTCGSCIQLNGTCGWCITPEYTGLYRCDTKDNLIKNGCAEDKVIQSINSAHLQKNRKAWKKRLLQPQKVVLQLVPNTGYVLPVKALLLTKNNDQRLGGHVVLSVKAPKPLKVIMKSDCNNNHPSPIETSSCHGVHNGPTVTFSFIILSESCFPKKKMIYIRTNNIKKPQLVITVKAKCECDCEMKKTTKKDVKHCNGKGKLKCGQCECDRGVYGRNCECDSAEESDKNNCIRPGDETVCSGNGNCICGFCHCIPDALGNDRFSGRYCSCDRMGCPKFNGSFCGGPERGECNCGQCGCRESYQGRACEIKLRSEKCVGSNGKICSGNGVCEQHQCHCKQPFYGETCEEFDDEPILAKYCKESDTSEVCSNQGICVKGSCKCYQAGYLTNQTFKGRYCECDDYHCEQFNGKLCGGFERGSCQCGKCRCREGFSGSACSVSIFTEQCISENGMICSNHGKCVNNRCQCQFGYTGTTCEQYGTLHRNLTRYCIERGKTEVCSNRGRCVQGRCICDRSLYGDRIFYTGAYCECDDQACERYNNELCGGRQRGICSCGKCRCFPGFFGSDCSVTEESKKCLSSDGKICSEKGNCVNNQCQCNERYQGPTCDEMVQTNDEYVPYCIARNSTQVCSKRGNCVRGRCDCHRTPHALDKKFTGRYCECDDYSCGRVNGKLCGGKDHGQCICGKCHCQKRYSGTNCTDDSSIDQCKSTNDKICNDHGICKKNKCQCDELYSGPTCEKYDRLLYSHTKKCRKSPDSPICSDRGDCIEGSCECKSRAPHSAQRYSGKYCECDDYSCDYYNGQLCGGPKRGICNCGRCRCQNGFLGSDCSGSNSTEGCRATNGRLCNGRGRCENNKCRCIEEYRGPTCEDCPTCPGLCKILKPCVLCRVFGTGSYTFEKCIKCLPIILVDNIEKMPVGRDVRFCLFLDDFDSCRVRFAVERRQGGQHKVTALTIKDCPEI